MPWVAKVRTCSKALGVGEKDIETMVPWFGWHIWQCLGTDIGVSENSGTPKSSILIGFSIINHPFWGTTIFGNIHMGST